MRGRRLARTLAVLLGAAGGILVLSGLADAQVRSPFGPPSLGPPGFGQMGAQQAVFAAAAPPPLFAPRAAAPVLLPPPLPAPQFGASHVVPALAPAPLFGFRPAFVGGVNTSILPIAVSGPAIGGNIGIVNAGPIGGIAGQIGNNVVIAPQLSFVHSGHAIAGSQVVGGLGLWSPFTPFSPFSPFGFAPYGALGAGYLHHHPYGGSVITSDQASGTAAVVGPRGASFKHGRHLTTYGPSGVMTSGPHGSAVLGPNGLITDTSGGRGHHSSHHPASSGYYAPLGTTVPYYAYGGTLLHHLPALWGPYSYGLLPSYGRATAAVLHARTADRVIHERERTLSRISTHSYFPAGAYGFAPYGYRTAFGYPGVVVSGPLGSFIGSPTGHMITTPLGSAMLGPAGYLHSGPLGSVIASPRGIIWSVPFLGGGIIGFPYAFLV